MKMMDYETGLTAEELRQCLNYDPETGIFHWLKTKCRSVKVGNIAGSIPKSGGGYRVILLNGRKKQYRAHRLAWLYIHGMWPKLEIDHINGIVDDNRLANLREATHAQNSRNRKTNADNVARRKGISFHKATGKWRARIRFSDEVIYLGLFNTPEEAHSAYCAAAERLHGEYARFK